MQANSRAQREQANDTQAAAGTDATSDNDQTRGVRPFSAPGLHVGGPANHSWRETALTRVYEIRTLAANFITPGKVQTPGNVQLPTLIDAIEGHLEAAEKAAAGKSSRRALISGSAVERTRSNLDAAEADLLRIAPLDYVAGQLPSILAHVRQHLPRHDPRRIHLEKIATRSRAQALTGEDRNIIIATVRGAGSEARREGARVRSFRNVLLVTAGLMTLVALGLALLGIVRPETLPVCFRPEDKVVCPTQEVDVPGQQAPAGTAATPAGSDRIAEAESNAVSSWDIPIIEGVGLIAAAIAGAAALRGTRGTSTPYSIPVALAALKLPTGAVTALLGLLLMRGEFVPGLSALDFPAQILAWAIVFGYAQQLFTRLVDQRGQQVLDAVGGPAQPSEP
jgi:hypothetical protein